MTDLDCIVIGAGLSGLVAAHSLKRAGLRVAVLERAHRVGGVIDTTSVGGFLCERGPNTLLTKESFRHLTAELALQVVPASSKAKLRYIVDRNSDRVLAFQPHLLQMLQKTPGALRMGLSIAREVWRARGAEEDESVESFLTRRFGEEICNRIFRPALSGIYAADISKLSARSALPTLWKMEQECGSVLRGYLRRRRSNDAPLASPHTATFPLGITELIAALTNSIGAEAIYTSANVLRVIETERGVAVHTDSQEFSAKHAMIACDAPGAATLIDPLDSDLASRLRQIPYASLGVLHLGVRSGDDCQKLQGFGILQGPRRNDPFLGAIFSSSLFERRAPEGWCLLTCFTGGAVYPEFSDVTNREIARRTVERVKKLLGLESEPEIVLSTYWERAIPNYPIFHHRTVERLAEFEQRHPRLSAIGNWREGVSVPDCIAQARMAAAALGK